MRIFEYPYVIITILLIGIIAMGAVGLYFFLKSLGTASSKEELGFSGVGKLEGEFKKTAGRRESQCVVYIHIDLGGASRLFAESRAMRILTQLRPILLGAFCVRAKGSLTPYGDTSFVAHGVCAAEEMKKIVKSCAESIERLFVANEVLNIARICFGIYSTQSTEVSFTVAVGRAKQACTMAEEQKLDFCEWDTAKAADLERKIKIENSIGSEIENNNFFLEYQPIIEAATEEIVGAEVFSRLNSDSDGILSPGVFLSAVNSVGLAEKFDYYIFEKNCKWISNNRAEREKYVYTINFSRETLCDEYFAEKIISIIEEYGILPSSTAIEILEDKELTAEGKERLIRNLKKLKEKGVRFLLDDFGKGYTSFTDLSNFKVDIVKIDKEITQNATSEAGLVILRNIIRTARDLGFRTLCEGIETEEQKNIVKAEGCDLMQGYYFYRPMQVVKLEELFAGEE